MEISRVTFSDSLYIHGVTQTRQSFNLSLQVEPKTWRDFSAKHKIMSGQELNTHNVQQQANLSEFVEKEISRQRFIAETKAKKEAELVAKQAKKEKTLADKQAKKAAELAAKQAKKEAAKKKHVSKNKEQKPRGFGLALRILQWCQEIKRHHPEYIKNKSGQRSLSWALWRLKKAMMSNQCFIKSNHITIRCLKVFLTVEGCESFEKMLQQ